jgi:hypothetical protein
MVRAFALAVVALAIAACGQAGARHAPAATLVVAYVEALREDDPRAAYALLSEGERETMSYGEFEQAWREAPAERARAAQALGELLDERGGDLEERAAITLASGEVLDLVRRGGAWRLDAPPAGPGRIPTPQHAAIRLAQAVSARDVPALLSLLTEERRTPLSERIEAFTRGLAAHKGDPIEHISDDLAALEWRDESARYRIIFRRQHDEWRIDEIHIMGLLEAD